MCARETKQTERAVLYYWNQDNFEGLDHLASALRSEPLLEPLARYCELRARGLRRKAFSALEEFLDTVRRQEIESQRAIALKVLGAHWCTPAVHQFLAHPLQHRFIEPVLLGWHKHDPLHPRPLAELALLRRDLELLERALQMNPADDRVRAAIVESLLRQVEFATHHLVEGEFIGSIVRTAAALDTAERVARDGNDPSRFEALVREVEDYRQLLDDWSEYSANPVGSFPAWCHARDRRREWPSIVYYDK